MIVCLYAEGQEQSNTAIEEMETLLKQVQGQAWGYSWMPLAAVEATVCLLAGTILRPAGKLRQALAYFARAEKAIDVELLQQHLEVTVNTFDAGIPFHADQTEHAEPC